MRNNGIAAVACVLGATLAWGYMRNANAQTDSAAKMKQTTTTSKVAKITKSDAEWKKILTPEQYDVMRQKGTERAFTGKYWHNEETGAYYCAACGLELFTSKTKFDSGTGWPSFYQEAVKGNIITHTDADGERSEVICARCGSHLGHVFTDGPKPTGLRYCMNSVSLEFKKDGDKSKLKAPALPAVTTTTTKK